MGIVEMMSDARTALTIICLVTFLGIVFWTFSGKRSTAFSAAEQLPFADEGMGGPPPQLEKPNV